MIATVAPGYAAGIPRTLSNKGVVFAAGKRAPFVGRVSMDMIGVDFSDMTAKVGDTVQASVLRGGSPMKMSIALTDRPAR